MLRMSYCKKSWVREFVLLYEGIVREINQSPVFQALKKLLSESERRNTIN